MIPAHAAAFLRANIAAGMAQRRLETREDIERYQAPRIAALIRHATARTQFYAGMAARHLQDMPIADKTLQTARFAEFNTLNLGWDEASEAANGRRALTGYDVGRSGGTTGQPALYLVSERERYRWLGTILRKLMPSWPLGAHRVAVVMPGASRLYGTARNACLDLRQFDSRTGPDRFAPDVAAFAPHILVAAPKSLRALAERGIKAAKAVSGSEVAGLLDTEAVERRLGIRMDQVYMATEGLFGTTCREGLLHLAEDIVHFELPLVAGLPDLCEPVVTDFTRQVQVMMRYRTGDLVRLAGGLCPCGSAMRVVKVIGRVADMIWLPREGGGAPVPLPADELDARLSDIPWIGDYRAGIAESASGEPNLAILVPQQTPDTALEAVASHMRTMFAAKRIDAALSVQRHALVTPFDRKLRRIAPVPPGML